MPDSITLTNDATSGAWLPLEGVTPGGRGAVSVTVTFNEPKLGLVFEARASARI
jgi:hypothetical protein